MATICCWPPESRLRAWKVLQRLRLVLSDTGNATIPPPPQRTFDVEGQAMEHALTKSFNTAGIQRARIFEKFPALLIDYVVSIFDSELRRRWERKDVVVGVYAEDRCGIDSDCSSLT
jgi:hypothetical protein